MAIERYYDVYSKSNYKVNKTTRIYKDMSKREDFVMDIEKNKLSRSNRNKNKETEDTVIISQQARDKYNQKSL